MAKFGPAVCAALVTSAARLEITVFDVLSYLAAAMSPSEILADFPHLEAADIEASLAYAGEREQRSLLAS